MNRCGKSKRHLRRSWRAFGYRMVCSRDKTSYTTDCACVYEGPEPVKYKWWSENIEMELKDHEYKNDYTYDYIDEYAIGEALAAHMLGWDK